MDLLVLLVGNDVIPVCEPAVQVTHPLLRRLHLVVVIILLAAILAFNAATVLEYDLRRRLGFVGLLEALGRIRLLFRGVTILLVVLGFLAVFLAILFLLGCVGRHFRQRIKRRLFEQLLVEPRHHEEISAARLTDGVLVGLGPLPFLAFLAARLGVAGHGGRGAESQDVFHAVLHPHDRLTVGGENLTGLQGQKSPLLHRRHRFPVIREALLRLQFGAQPRGLAGHIDDLQIA